MSVLIVLLPLAPGNGADLRYVQTRDGFTVDKQGDTPATTLPSTGMGDDVVAVVPVHALSWHRVDLPKGALNGAQARLRSVLDGLLEERLLDDPAQVHLAVSPDGKAGEPLWVAACDKAWLKSALAPLEGAGRPVSRIVPECQPLEVSSDASARLLALGDTEQGSLIRCSKDGVLVLPLRASAIQALRQTVAALDGDELFAEPAAVDAVEQWLDRQPQLQQPAQRWLLATQSGWDLAQFDLANSGRQRSLKKLGDQWRKFLYGPQWRAARWGFATLLLANLVGLNAWAWKAKAELNTQRAEIRNVLTQTFPHVKLVVDAPIQMAREVAQLRQSAGAASGQDLESMLGTLGQALPPLASGGPAQLKGIDYAEGELQLKGLPDDTVASLRPRLEAQGYTLRADADRWLLRVGAKP